MAFDRTPAGKALVRKLLDIFNSGESGVAVDKLGLALQQLGIEPSIENLNGVATIAMAVSKSVHDPSHVVVVGVGIPVDPEQIKQEEGRPN